MLDEWSRLSPVTVYVTCTALLSQEDTEAQRAHGQVRAEGKCQR